MNMRLINHSRHCGKALILCAGVLAALAVLTPASAGGLKLKLSKSQEKSMAQDMYEDIKRDPGLVSKGKDYELIQQIGKRLVSKNNLTEYEYKFFLVKQDEVNAFATPGGYIYITQGLMQYMGYDPAMLAGVMAHEIGHAKDRHVARGVEKQLQASMGLGVLSMILGDRGGDVTDYLGPAIGIAQLSYSRDMEEWADRYGVELTHRAGYDAYGMVRGLETLQGLYGSVSGAEEWMTNHPSNSSRIKRTSQIAEEVSGRKMGYIKIPCPPKKHPLYEKYKGICGGSGSSAGEGDEGIGKPDVYIRGQKQTGNANNQDEDAGSAESYER
jgi:predicted Zn-dependent protease